MRILGLGRIELALLLALGLPLTAAGQVAQTPVDGVDLFETQVLPVLERKCFACHSDPDRAKSELVLAGRAGLLRGGARGPAIDPEDPDASLLLQAVSYNDEQLEMPPSGRLAEEEIEALRQWVRLGAPYGGEDDELTVVAAGDRFEITEQDRQWWSVRPLVRPTVPHTEDDGWANNGIDSFVLSRLESRGLKPAGVADRRTLIRRATYDLTGLPATAEEVAAFEGDERPDAWERLIDRLLASPHYGEKWGRHWLDLVRYAETMGYERDSLKPGAWRYRDWVINALNEDMPYDEFLVHQLAGDEIEEPTLDSIIATGYLRLAIWDDEPTDVALAQYDDLDSILDTTSRVMLGMSMGCARCHNHRGDPIPQRDYYRMLAFFRGVAPYKVGGGNTPNPENYVERIPEDFGTPAAEVPALRWQAARAAQLDEVRSIVRAASDRAETGELAAAQAAWREVESGGLVAHLPLEEDTALVAVDEVGRHHGRVEQVSVGAQGKFGHAYAFDGEDDAVRLPRPVADDFTISFWFKTEVVARGGTDLRWYQGDGLVDGNASGDKSDFGVSVVGDGFVAAGTGSPYTYLASDAGYNDGAWHHVALTREHASGLLRLYVDGEPVDEAVGTTALLDASEFVDLGRLAQGGGYFEGALDEVRFYDRPLTHKEILSQFLEGATTESFVGLVARYDRAQARRLEQLTETLIEERRPPREYFEVLRVKESGPEAPPTHVLIRGNPHAPAEPVEPGFPQILTDAVPSLPQRDDSARSTGRRLALARWIASDENIRTSRVMANRLWQYHFGRGLAPTPNDFGRFGREPTHPELLDWLAMELIDRDWSLKSMHRLIMTSQAYQMSSEAEEHALATDPENTLLWRYDMRRLTAEEIRDSILAKSGTLNLQTGGPAVYPPLPEAVLATSSRPDEVWGKSTEEQAARRSVYIHVKRSLLHPLLEALDLADTDATCPVRFTTTQPTQALTLLNSDFMNKQAALLAQRVSREVGRSSERRVARALEIVLSRPPSSSEVERGLDLVRDLQQEEHFSFEQAFNSFCLLLLNLNEFVYLD